MMNLARDDRAFRGRGDPQAVEALTLDLLRRGQRGHDPAVDHRTDGGADEAANGRGADTEDRAADGTANGGAGRAERQARPLTLILGDIDHFKRINDTYGHLVGDVVLKRVAQVVQSCVRKVDIAARYGGEEFAIVLEATDAVGGRQLAERVRQEVQKLVLTAEAGSFGCTLSLGIATSTLGFGLHHDENVLDATNHWKLHVTDAAQLAGLNEGVLASAARTSSLSAAGPVPSSTGGCSTRRRWRGCGR